MNGTLRLGALALLVTLGQGVWFGCGPKHELVAGPSDGFAVAGLSAQRAAVLKGDNSTKSIFIINLRNGEVVFSFGVPKEATDVAAAGPYGPLLITTGHEEGGRAIGSLEFWTLGGTRTYIVPLPAYALGITHARSPRPYVLVRNGLEDRVAVPVDLAKLTVGRGIGLPLGSEGIELCSHAGKPALVYNEGRKKTLAMRMLGTEDILHSSTVADHPTCLPGRSELYAITRGPSSAGIAIVSLDNLAQVAVAPASLEATALAESSEHHLIALNSRGNVSNLETFPDSALQAGVTKPTVP